MAKIKPLLPTLRERKRYLCFEIVSKNKVNFAEAYRQLWFSLQSFLGELGLARANVLVLNNYDAEMQRGIIKASHRLVNEVKSALMFVKEICRDPAIVLTVGVSGIIKMAVKRYMSAVA